MGNLFYEEARRAYMLEQDQPQLTTIQALCHLSLLSVPLAFLRLRLPRLLTLAAAPSVWAEPGLATCFTQWPSEPGSKSGSSPPRILSGARSVAMPDPHRLSLHGCSISEIRTCTWMSLPNANHPTDRSTTASRRRVSKRLVRFRNRASRSGPSNATNPSGHHTRSRHLRSSRTSHVFETSCALMPSSRIT